MQIELSTKLAKYALALAIPLAAGTYFLASPAKTKTTATAAPTKGRVVRVDTETTPTVPRDSERPINKPLGPAVRPQPGEGRHYAPTRLKPGKQIQKPKNSTPAA